MELLRKISSKFICIGSNPLKNAEVFYIGGSDTLPPPLKKDEEEALMKKLANGDMSVKATLIERNLRLVVYIARKFENTGIYVEDLISIGTIGLIKAINTFNPLKNIKLATYASRCIENEILMQICAVRFLLMSRLMWIGTEMNFCFLIYSERIMMLSVKI